MNKVNLLLIPYNYILDPKIRKQIGINITDCIIVFDEAHNLESKAESCCSLKLDMKDLKFT